MTASETLASRIQYTRIEIGVTESDVRSLCRECLDYGFHAAMIPPTWVPLTADLLSGSSVRVASAVDFPLGVMSTRGKVAEATSLVEGGAQELDIGVNLGYLRSGRDDAFEADLRAVVEAARGRPVKVMLELPLLTPDERERAVERAVSAGVAYLKNASSGVVGTASPEDMRFLRERAPRGVGVKASGGIRTRGQVEALLAAGADLVGTSAAVAIVTGTADPAAPTY
jgi:deoxyribose-phosphate aldolase